MDNSNPLNLDSLPTLLAELSSGALHGVRQSGAHKTLINFLKDENAWQVAVQILRSPSLDRASGVYVLNVIRQLFVDHRWSHLPSECQLLIQQTVEDYLSSKSLKQDDFVLLQKAADLLSLMICSREVSYVEAYVTHLRNQIKAKRFQCHIELVCLRSMLQLGLDFQGLVNKHQHERLTSLLIRERSALYSLLADLSLVSYLGWLPGRDAPSFNPYVVSQLLSALLSHLDPSTHSDASSPVFLFSLWLDCFTALTLTNLSSCTSDWTSFEYCLFSSFIFSLLQSPAVTAPSLPPSASGLASKSFSHLHELVTRQQCLTTAHRLPVLAFVSHTLHFHFSQFSPRFVQPFSTESTGESCRSLFKNHLLSLLRSAVPALLAGSGDQSIFNDVVQIFDFLRLWTVGEPDPNMYAACLDCWLVLTDYLTDSGFKISASENLVVCVEALKTGVFHRMFLSNECLPLRSLYMRGNQSEADFRSSESDPETVFDKWTTMGPHDQFIIAHSEFDNLIEKSMSLLVGLHELTPSEEFVGIILATYFERYDLFFPSSFNPQSAANSIVNADSKFLADLTDHVTVLQCTRTFSDHVSNWLIKHKASLPVSWSPVCFLQSMISSLRRLIPILTSQIQLPKQFVQLIISLLSNLSTMLTSESCLHQLFVDSHMTYSSPNTKRSVFQTILSIVDSLLYESQADLPVKVATSKLYASLCSSKQLVSNLVQNPNCVCTSSPMDAINSVGKCVCLLSVLCRSSGLYCPVKRASLHPLVRRSLATALLQLIVNFSGNGKGQPGSAVNWLSSLLKVLVVEPLALPEAADQMCALFVLDHLLTSEVERAQASVRRLIFAACNNVQLFGQLASSLLHNLGQGQASGFTDLTSDLCSGLLIVLTSITRTLLHTDSSVTAMTDLIAQLIRLLSVPQSSPSGVVMSIPNVLVDHLLNLLLLVTRNRAVLSSNLDSIVDVCFNVLLPSLAVESGKEARQPTATIMSLGAPALLSAAVDKNDDLVVRLYTLLFAVLTDGFNLIFSRQSKSASGDQYQLIKRALLNSMLHAFELVLSSGQTSCALVRLTMESLLHVDRLYSLFTLNCIGEQWQFWLADRLFTGLLDAQYDGCKDVTLVCLRQLALRTMGLGESGDAGPFVKHLLIQVATRLGRPLSSDQLNAVPTLTDQVTFDRFVDSVIGQLRAGQPAA